jgi:hypothetical protein
MGRVATGFLCSLALGAVVLWLMSVTLTSPAGVLVGMHLR